MAIHVKAQDGEKASATRAPLLSREGSAAMMTRGTETAVQEQRILARLRVGTATTDQLRELGIYQVSARIFGLRAKGYNIITELFNGVSADGYAHARMARYELIEEVPACSA